MHTLLLLRHAHSDSVMGGKDHDRPLSSTGIIDVPRMAQRLKERGYKPDRVISSDALRAITTAEIFTDMLGTDLSLSKELYNAHEKTVLDLIREMDEEVQELMLVGHNPTWEVLVEDLTGQNRGMHPCSMVQISFDCLWKELKEGSGKIIYSSSP